MELKIRSPLLLEEVEDQYMSRESKNEDIDIKLELRYCELVNRASNLLLVTLVRISSALWQ
jgi:hypothetical protein